ncbi:MAG: hypothetical protein K2P92_00690, partial [Bdellovibrionaceae bacterium]|nr:hypothetical protein [Pseudobdellovibrionaceae bacterium]
NMARAVIAGEDSPNSHHNGNQTKANRTPEKARMPLQKPPRAPNWLPVVEFSLSVNQEDESFVVWKDYLRFKTN